MDSPLLNFVCEREIHPIPLFSSDRGLDRTKGTETGYEGNQRAWRKEREREGERIHQQEPPRGVGVVCHWQTFIPQLRSEQSFAVRYAQPRFSFSFFFLSLFRGNRGGNRRQSDADADHRMGTDDNCFS